MRRDSFTERTVLTPTESRQASPRRMNLRVLTASLLILAFIGVLLLVAFDGTAPESGGTTPGPATTQAPISGQSDVIPAPAPETEPKTAP